MQDTRFTDYVFKRHSLETVRAWALSLQYFRFCRAYGGHANDGDSFRCALRIHDEASLLGLCRSLSLSLVLLPLDTPRPIPGKRYSLPEFDKFRQPIDAFPRYERPGHTTLFGVPAFVWVRADSVEIHLSGAGGDSYEVTDLDFENAKRLEGEFRRLGLEFCDPPMDSPNCICPKFWPELFTNDVV